MSARPIPYNEDLVVVRPEERPWGFFVHAVGWIPIWGFVFNAAVWLYFKNRSREMIFHVQQSIQFQIFILIPILAWSVASIFTSVLSNVALKLSEVLQTANTFLLFSFLTACAAAGIAGGAMVYIGKPFLYPVFGKRVLEGSIRKFRED
ncbi:hypothetical protein BH09SUM1_BH09SUM1_19780 [soil metagenome]